MNDSTEYILLQSSRVDLVGELVCQYFEDESISRKGINVRVLYKKSVGQILIEFLSKIDNDSFVFFFGFLSIEKEFQKDDNKGWFNLSPVAFQFYEFSDVRDVIKSDGPSVRVMLTTEFTEDYNTGFSKSGCRLEFGYGGQLGITESKGFQENEVDFTSFNVVKKINLSAKKSVVEHCIDFNQDISSINSNRKGCLMYIFFLGLVLFSFLGVIIYIV